LCVARGSGFGRARRARHEVPERGCPPPNPVEGESSMTTSERAVQIWPVLALAARNRQVLTYNMLARLVGMPRMALGQCLEPIQSYCLLRNLEPLTILVVSEKSGIPGIGFIAAADIPKTQQSVFSHDWLEHGCPSPEDFEKAVKDRPSNGVTVPEE
jgi:hypothetical protein